MNPFASPQASSQLCRVKKLNWSLIPMVATFASLTFLFSYGFASAYAYVCCGVWLPFWPNIVGCMCYWFFKFVTGVLLTIEWERYMRDWRMDR